MADRYQQHMCLRKPISLQETHLLQQQLLLVCQVMVADVLCILVCLLHEVVSHQMH